VNDPTLRGRLQRAMALHRAGRLAEARLIYEEILGGQPGHFDALHLLGVISAQERDPASAVALIGRAIEANPDNAAAYAAHINRGLAQEALRQFPAALASYDRAIAIAADSADAHFNRGNVLNALKQIEAAIASYDAAIALGSRNNGVYGVRRHARMEICDWREFEADVAAIAGRIQGGQAAADPFVLLTLSDSAALQRRAAENWVRQECPPAIETPATPPRRRDEVIRIGYFSADYYDHATSHLAAGLFEMHNRSRFSLVGFSFGPEARDAIRTRVAAAFDEFLDVRTLADDKVACLARDKQIDIAVDLKGFTQNSRAGIFAHRAAPVQASYLGYPGTMGAPYMDYLVADHVLIPSASRPHYSEKVVYLPNSYQVNDRQRRIGEREFSRAELALPPQGIVFCCFNNSFKITPEVFDCWMRILKATPGSVLWLLQDNKTAARNLCREARARGVEDARLVFAPRVALPEHLARLRAADLCLDTVPCNSHTTASDALWVGVPILTRAGESFAARVCASLLHAMEMDELITTSAQEYEATAIALATDPERLRTLRARVWAQRMVSPLFDTRLLASHLEAAFGEMHRRRQAGLPPSDIDVGTLIAE
jgi:predicted O-linked N-acetylglucosamine transferase (SPINDLY family)